MDPNIFRAIFSKIDIFCSAFFNLWLCLVESWATKGNNAVLKRRTEQGGMNLVDGFTLIIGGDTV